MIRPFIFGLKIKDRYDRAMLFCRYQEFYESPYKNIHGKFFTLEEFMRTYSKSRNKGYFSYPDDWTGFNIPSENLNKAIKLFKKDFGPYDHVMKDVVEFCNSESTKHNHNKKHKWYLIGYPDCDLATLNHEIAHGLFYTNDQYRSLMIRLVDKLTKRDYNYVKKKLLNLGYRNDKTIICDETQAYFSTGLDDTFDGDNFRNLQDNFIKTFNKFTKTKN